VSVTCTRGRMAPGSRDLCTARNRFCCYAVPFIWISSPDRPKTGASMRVSQVVRIPSQSVDPSVGRWLTPERGTLQGITRRSMIELARETGQPARPGGQEPVAPSMRCRSRSAWPLCRAYSSIMWV
jgi:hypothetical protein